MYNKLTHISSFFFKKITLCAKSAKDPLFFGITYKNKFKLIKINKYKNYWLDIQSSTSIEGSQFKTFLIFPISAHEAEISIFSDKCFTFPKPKDSDFLATMTEAMLLVE